MAAAGAGTAADPFVLTCASHLELIRKNLSASFVLGADIELSEHVPFGVFDRRDQGAAVPFRGTLDGAGHVLSGFSIQGETDLASGLFAYTSGATIRNLTLAGGSLSLPTTFNAGPLVGYAINTRFEGVTIRDTQVLPSLADSVLISVGGLAGTCWVDSGIVGISNASIEVSLEGADAVAGLCGLARVRNGATMSISDVDVSATLTQNFSGNTFGGVLGHVSIEDVGSHLSIDHVTTDTDITVDELNGGSWSSSFLATLDIRDSMDVKVSIADVEIRGQLSSVADFNVRGSLGGFAGVIVVEDSVGVELVFDRVGSFADIGILSNAVTSNRYLGGLIGGYFVARSTSVDLNLVRCFAQTRISSVNDNTVESAGGLIGHAEGDLPNGVRGFTIDTCYARVNDGMPSTIIDALALVGSAAFAGGYQFEDVYFNAPARMLTANEGGAPNESAETTLLTEQETLEASSYQGPRWDFTSTWKIEPGQLPTLR